MKIKTSFTSTIDKNGFGINFIPTFYIGWENGYLKVIQIDSMFLFWEVLITITLPSKFPQPTPNYPKGGIETNENKEPTVS